MKVYTVWESGMWKKNDIFIGNLFIFLLHLLPDALALVTAVLLKYICNIQLQHYVKIIIDKLNNFSFECLYRKLHIGLSGTMWYVLSRLENWNYFEFFVTLLNRSLQFFFRVLNNSFIRLGKYWRDQKTSHYKHQTGSPNYYWWWGGWFACYWNPKS